MGRNSGSVKELINDDYVDEIQSQVAQKRRKITPKKQQTPKKTKNKNKGSVATKTTVFCYCGLNFSSKSQVAKHLNNTGHGVQCSVCLIILSTDKDVDEHLKLPNHENAKFRGRMPLDSVTTFSRPKLHNHPSISQEEALGVLKRLLQENGSIMPITELSELYHKTVNQPWESVVPHPGSFKAFLKKYQDTFEMFQLKGVKKGAHSKFVKLLLSNEESKTETPTKLPPVQETPISDLTRFGFKTPEKRTEKALADIPEFDSNNFEDASSVLLKEAFLKGVVHFEDILPKIYQSKDKLMEFLLYFLNHLIRHQHEFALKTLGNALIRMLKSGHLPSTLLTTLWKTLENANAYKTDKNIIKQISDLYYKSSPKKPPPTKATISATSKTIETTPTTTTVFTVPVPATTTVVNTTVTTSTTTKTIETTPTPTITPITDPTPTSTTTHIATSTKAVNASVSTRSIGVSTEPENTTRSQEVVEVIDLSKSVDNTESSKRKNEAEESTLKKRRKIQEPSTEQLTPSLSITKPNMVRICPVPAYDVYGTLSMKDLESYVHMIRERDQQISSKQEEFLNREFQIVQHKQDLQDLPLIKKFYEDKMALLREKLMAMQKMYDNIIDQESKTKDLMSKLESRQREDRLQLEIMKNENQREKMYLTELQIGYNILQAPK